MGVRGLVSGEDDGVIERDGDCGGGEGDGAPGITQLSHRDEGGRGEGGDNVNMTGSRGKVVVCYSGGRTHSDRCFGCRC